MRVALVILVGLLSSAALRGQEVVVFDSSRSLIVQSHRRDGDWVYLRVSSGELAVRAECILRIEREGVTVSDQTAADLQGPAPQPAPSEAAQPRRGRDREAERAAREKRNSKAVRTDTVPKEPKPGVIRGPAGRPGGFLKPGGREYEPMTLQGGSLPSRPVAVRRKPADPKPAASGDAVQGD